MNRRQFCAAAAIGFTRSVAAAPVPRTPDKRTSLLFQRLVPGDCDPGSELIFEWLLVDPDGSNLRPMFGWDGHAVPLEVPHRQAIVLRTSIPNKEVALLKPDGNSIVMSWVGGPIERAIRTSWKSSRRVGLARTAKKASYPDAPVDAVRWREEFARQADDSTVPITVLEPDGCPACFTSFSPDGNRLAFFTSHESGGAPFVLDIQTELLVCIWDKIPEIAGEIDFDDVKFSPDLRWFAYAVTEGRNWVADQPGRTILHVTAIDGRTSRRHPEASWEGNLCPVWDFTNDGQLVIDTDPPRGFNTVTGRPTTDFIPPPDLYRLGQECNAPEPRPCPWGEYCWMTRSNSDTGEEFRVVRELATKQESRLPTNAENGFHWVRATRI